MALTEKKIIDLIQITENFQIQVRESNVIQKDGVEIARSFHRYVLQPGDDISTQDQKIKDIASVIWTPETIAAFQASIQNP